MGALSHLMQDNCISNEKPGVMPIKDIKISKEIDIAFRVSDKMKITKEAEIIIFGNDKDRDNEILSHIKANLDAIEILDHLSEINNPETIESFILSLHYIMRMNIIDGIPFFNQIITRKLPQGLQVIEPEDLPENSTDGSSIGDEND